ncbi:cyclase family protein [Novosphingobium sp. KACC 22771]|uniref:cyclase family protein n=1 Tax=Novosphingobium sp. KACC 22771 TaxID=3025670 RepID=UPI0023662B99|nr:cyclase family protein [Novosphingobium sp. KACC 22771]WDF75156.1 cyclase family protein [Novosphingobium sp. KACC 22771]
MAKYKALAAFLALAPVCAHAAPDHTVTQQTIDGWKKTQSNWGRWGPDDQKGTLNLITPAVRKQAAALVQTGTAISLSREIVPQHVAGEAPAAPAPVQQRMLSGPPKRPTGSTDSLTIAAHGYTITHFDALGHHLFDGKMYNGYAASEHLSMENGLTRGSIAAYADGVFTRGVLVDMPLLKGVPYLEPGTPIYAEDLEAWEKFAGIKIGAGDAVFIRTGRWEREAAKGPWDVGKQAAGLDASTIPWLRARNIALLGSETALSVVPFPATTTITNPDDYLPVHNFALVAFGMPLIDDTDLGTLAKTAGTLKRWTFLLTVAPIRVTTGTGVPVNPIATF